ncbi:MAG TPA: gamma-glutamyltransferase family protein [Blastocatellia bacterium]|nr:gamma-glutamyltransferase family protein [Blastocatellia bacterium]
MTSRLAVRLLVFVFALSILASSSAQTLTYRPTVRGTRGIVAGGHPLVAEAGLRMMHKGGNAVDAGVAATLAASVIEFSHFAFGGEVPIIIKMANKPQPITINGQGQAPQLATIEFFEKQRKDPSKPAVIPSTGPTAATVPGVLDAMIVALQNYGTMKLADVMQPAIELADGFPIDELRVQYIKNTRPAYESWKDTTDIFLPKGEVPKIGDIFVQKNLARTLRELVAVEKKNAGRGRVAALQAARDHFYRGPLGKRYCDAIEKAGGLMRAGDLAAFKADIDQPTKVSFHGYDVYKVGFWSQGPAMLEAMNLIESYDLKGMGHNSPDYVHTIVEAIKLAFADRDRYYADPRFVKVPGAELLSKDYADVRRVLIDPKSASLEQRPGDPVNKKSLAQLIGFNLQPVEIPEAERAHDTTCVNVIDAAGNVFSATPSGAWLPSFVAGDTGIPISSRLQSALLERGHPNELKGGKRPRVTLSPTLVMKDGQPFAALSTPGGDNQDQALIQTLLNIIEFGMNPQQAVEAARFETQHFVSSFSDHQFRPGSMTLERRMGEALIAEMKRRGHKVEVSDDFSPSAAPTIVIFDPKTKLIQAGADARRGRYAMGW